MGRSLQHLFLSIHQRQTPQALQLDPCLLPRRCAPSRPDGCLLLCHRQQGHPFPSHHDRCLLPLRFRHPSQEQESEHRQDRPIFTSPFPPLHPYQSHHGRRLRVPQPFHQAAPRFPFHQTLDHPCSHPEQARHRRTFPSHATQPVGALHSFHRLGPVYR